MALEAIHAEAIRLGGRAPTGASGSPIDDREDRSGRGRGPSDRRRGDRMPAPAQ